MNPESATLKSYRSLFESSSAASDEEDFLRFSEGSRDHIAQAQSEQSCLICLEVIESEDAIWHCETCFVCLHMPCIHQWIRQSEVPVEGIEPLKTWGCPKCRTQYRLKDQIPREYRCFCGKVENPPLDRWLIPHTCGDTCGKHLIDFNGDNCGHECKLLCHPGRCPPCPQTIMVKCFCGGSKSLRRCALKRYACSQPCNKVLGCKKHTHADGLCHDGPCPVCPKKSVQKCFCGAKQMLRPCSDPTFKCENICGKQLECGKHACAVVCCPGNCGKCPRSGPRTCPCGKHPVDLPCDVDPSSCGLTCDRKLACRHKCVNRCHSGRCEPCQELVTRRCTCGRTERTIVCSGELICDKKCGRLLPCGRHTCKQKCCKGQCGQCQNICGKTLPCGKHKCSAPCHRGPCFPCPLVTRVECGCSHTIISIPCGRERKAKMPECQRPCDLPLPCGHTQSTHMCHYGPCPPCPHPCDKRSVKNPDEIPTGNTGSSCGHLCPLPCHAPFSSIPSRPPPPPFLLRSFAADPSPSPATPSEKIPGVLADSHFPSLSPTDARPKILKSQNEICWEERAKISSEICPDCPVIVTRRCVGGHESKEVRCSEIFESCGKSCGKLLKCENHNCKKKCHRPDENCDTCVQKCLIGKECKHACLSGCHPPPCPPCEREINKICFCGKTAISLPCHALRALSPSPSSSLSPAEVSPLVCGLRCEKKFKNCNHLCSAQCHPGDCPNPTQCTKSVTVRCKCKTLKEEWICADYQAANLSSIFHLPCSDACVSVSEETPTAGEEREEASMGEGMGDGGKVRLRRWEVKKLKEEETQRARDIAEQNQIQEQKKNRLKIIAVVILLIFICLLAYVILTLPPIPSPSPSPPKSKSNFQKKK